MKIKQSLVKRSYGSARMSTEFNQETKIKQKTNKQTNKNKTTNKNPQSCWYKLLQISIGTMAVWRYKSDENFCAMLSSIMKLIHIWAKTLVLSIEGWHEYVPSSALSDPIHLNFTYTVNLKLIQFSPSL